MHHNKKKEKDNNFFNSTPTTTVLQSEQQSTSTKNTETASDIIVYAKTIGKQNDNNEQQEVQSPLCLSSIISNTNVKEVEVHQIYNKKQTLKTVMNLYAISNNFQFRVIKSCGRKFFIKCIDENCTWRLRASRYKNTTMFRIREFKNEHSCSLEARLGNQHHATTSMIADCIKSKYSSLKTVYTPADIIRDMQKDYGVSISYMKAWRSKETALEFIRGKPEESFSFLPSFLYMIEKTNRGSVVDLKTNNENRFLYVYMSLQASIHGWQHCIPVIVVDGTFLKIKFGGTLLTASTQDASGKIFPLAFAVVDSENDSSWIWFFAHLRKTLGMRDKLTIVSDRHQSIELAIKEVYPEAAHVFCIYHILNNIKTNFKKSTVQIKELFLQAANSYKVEQFEKHMLDIEKIDARVYEYLNNIGHEKWTKVHSQNNRFRTMTSNIAESLNSAIKYARELPVTTLLEYLRGLMQQWTSTNRNIARGTFKKLAKKPDERLTENYIKSLKFNVRSSTFLSNFKYHA